MIEEVTEEAVLQGLIFTMASDIERSGWLPTHPSDQVNANNAIGIAEYLVERGYRK